MTLAPARSAGDTVLTCVVNLGAAPVALDGYGTPLVASAPLTDQLLPVDAAAWFERR
ncbi:hypothetical protein ACLQ25_20115 [Micromonospora sp. DT44]|uniref:hypothetical protein n=1 Tax=Micromonospora sp. DT44 TaxID=3393439 RepID=UPI003CE72B94